MAKKPTKDDKRHRRAAEAFAALLLAANRGQGRGAPELVDAWRGLDPIARNEHLPAVQAVVATALASALSGKVDGVALERWISTGCRAPETFGSGDDASERWWALLRMCLLRRSTTLGRRAWQHLAAATAASSAHVHAFIDGLLTAPDGPRDVATLSHLSHLARHLPALTVTAAVGQKSGSQHERPTEVTPALIARLFAGPAAAIAEVRALVRRASSSQARDAWEAVAPFALRQAIRDDDDAALSLFIEALEKSAKSASLERDLTTCLAWLATKLGVKTSAMRDSLVRIGEQANAWGVPFDDALLAAAFELAANSPEGCTAIGPLLTQTLVSLAAAHVVGSEASGALVRACLRTSLAIDVADEAGFDVDAVHRVLHRVHEDVLRASQALKAALEELGPSLAPLTINYLINEIPVQSVPLAVTRLVATGVSSVLSVLVADLPEYFEWLDIKANWPQLTDVLVRDFQDICDELDYAPDWPLSERQVFQLLAMCTPAERPLMVRPVFETVHGKEIPVSEVTLATWQEIGPALLAFTPRAIHIAYAVHRSAQAMVDDSVRALVHFDMPEEALEFLMTLDPEEVFDTTELAEIRVAALEGRFAGLPRLWHRLFASHPSSNSTTMSFIGSRVLSEDHASGTPSAEGREVRRVFKRLAREFDKLMPPPAKLKPKPKPRAKPKAKPEADPQ